MTKRTGGSSKSKDGLAIEFLAINAEKLGEVVDLMREVRALLVEIAGRGSSMGAGGRFAQLPAVPISESITPSVIACLECGENFRALRFHLRMHGLSPTDYRAKWGLPIDYPMVAPQLAERRSVLARESHFRDSRKRKARESRPAH